MTEEPRPAVGSDPEPESTAELAARLRAAEAQVEHLESALKSHESLAGQMGDAIDTARQAKVDLEQQRLGVSVAGTIRILKAGVMRRLRRGNPQQAAPAPTHTASRWSGTETTIVDSRYQQWVELYDTVDDETREAIGAQVAALVDTPLVSIVLPVYNTSEEYLREAIESVRAQIYRKWELCISDDCSTMPHVAKVLDEYCKLDERVRVVYRPENGHISATSNSAVEIARGEWICLMDHDDVLAEHALAIAVLALAQVPEAGILYSDEDHLSETGKRSAPYFKPDFDPLLILGQNYFSHLSLLRSDLVRKVGGFRLGVEGSQDWDLVLRVLDQISPAQVVHVPHVLYHWRSHPESTASSLSAKPYVVEASRRVVQEHLDRCGVAATATTIRGTSFNRIRWSTPAEPPLVSVIILPRSGSRFVRTLDSVRTRSTYPSLEIVVIDDGAFRPPMRQYLRDNAGWLTVVEDANDLSDSAQRNRAAEVAQGQILCFLHDDVEILTDTWLEELVGTLSYPGIGAAGAKMLYPELTIQPAGIVIGIGGTIGHTHRLHFDNISPGYFGRLMLQQCPSAVSWACLATRREAFEAVGGFSEEHFTGMFGDIDYCLRIGVAGWRTGWTPHSELIHFERPEDSRGIEGENAVRFDRDIRMLTTSWNRWVTDDPAYNPNLSLAHESLPLAWPPRKPLTQGTTSA
jgi:GT2 family glycosyltransferase